MVVGLGTLSLHLPAGVSLKGKRQVLRSITARVRRRFNVAIAEVDAQDSHRWAVLAIACVSDSSRYASQLLSEVVAFIEQTRPDVEVVEVRTEVLPGG